MGRWIASVVQDVTAHKVRKERAVSRRWGGSADWRAVTAYALSASDSPAHTPVHTCHDIAVRKQCT